MTCAVNSASATPHWKAKYGGSSVCGCVLYRWSSSGKSDRRKSGAAKSIDEPLDPPALSMGILVHEKVRLSQLSEKPYSRLRLIIVDSGIPHRTPRAPWLCNSSFSFHTGPRGAAALSGGRRNASQYFGHDTSVHRNLVGDGDPLGCPCGSELPTRSLCPCTTTGSSRHRRPDRPKRPRDAF